LAIAIIFSFRFQMRVKLTTPFVKTRFPPAHWDALATKRAIHGRTRIQPAYANEYGKARAATSGRTRRKICRPVDPPPGGEGQARHSFEQVIEILDEPF
jgi:hypothetical protein